MQKLQIALIIGAFIYLVIIFSLLKKQKISVRYALPWLASGLVMLLFACFPYLAKILRAITGVEVVSNLVFIIIIAFMLLIVLNLSAAVTDLSERAKRLTQTNALLEERVRRLENSAADQNRDEDIEKE